MTDLRDDLREGLEGKLSPEVINKLLDEVLSIKKQARGWCPTCKKAVQVEISDPKAVVAATTELLNQTMGRPKEAGVSESERISFERVVYLGE